MALAINLLALLIVLGLCWAAMVWLSGKSHGHGGRSTSNLDDRITLDTFARVERERATPQPEPCSVCDGVGAHNTAGRLAPCTECFGTGVPQ